MFGPFRTQELTDDFKPHVRLVVLEEDLLKTFVQRSSPAPQWSILCVGWKRGATNKFRFDGAFGVKFLFIGGANCCPFPKDIIAPVCPWQLSWMTWMASTHHRMVVRLLAERLSFTWQVPQSYQRTLFSLPQPSFSGRFKHVMRKETAGCKSCLLHLHRKSNWATVWWKAWACFSGRNVAVVLLQIMKRWLAAGVVHNMMMALRKLVNIF